MLCNFATVFLLLMWASFSNAVSVEPHDYQRLVDKKLWITEHYPPYHYVTNNEIDGIAVRVLVEIFKRNNLVFNPNEKFVVFPWARALRELKSNSDAVIVSMGYTEERNSLFRLSKPLFSESISLITTKSSQATQQDLTELLIGVVRDDIGEKLLISKFSQPLNLAYVQSSEELLLMLLKQRVDAVAYSKQLIDYQISKMGLSEDDFDLIQPLAEVPATIGFNRDSETSLLQLINETIHNMHKDGSMERIIRAYQIQLQKQ